MGISPLILHSLVHAEFNTSHKNDKNVEKAYFCVDCGGDSLTEKDKQEKHSDHKVFRAKKASHHYAYTKDDIRSLGEDVLDVNGVSLYSINSTFVYYLKSRLSDKKPELKGKYKPCISCGFGIERPSLFCSILCKLQYCNQEPETAKEVMEDEKYLVGCSFKNKKWNKKNKKKGGENFGCKNLEVKGGVETKKLHNLINVVEENGVGVRNISFRKRSRKGVPKRAPLF